MLKLPESVDIQELSKFGFHQFTYRYKQTDGKQVSIKWWYKAIACNSICIHVNDITREYYINDWSVASGRFMHKEPKCRYREYIDIYDVIYLLVKNNLAISEKF